MPSLASSVDAPAPALQSSQTTQQKVSDILSAVSKASQSPSTGSVQPSYNVTVVMPGGQSTNLASPPAAAPASAPLAPLPLAPLPAMTQALPTQPAQPSPALTSEYMKAVATSIQKTKQEDEEKH